MERIISTDGTPIAYQRSGTGPPLVLVHGGAASDHTRWTPLVERLADHCTIYAMDRRGRGGSGDADDYVLEREFDDVAALASSVDGPVSVYGVSAGANFALEAALKTPNLHRLALYEPVIPDGIELTPPDFVERIERLIAEGNAEEAVITLLREAAQVPPHEIEALRATPTWPARVAAAHTLVREERAVTAYRFDPHRFRDMTVPTLLLLGSESPLLFRSSIETLHAVLPNSRVHILHGQRHLADVTAPEQVADALLAFLDEP
jgi:pimeloyl-ACP methyl ester carboxylesterase